VGIQHGRSAKRRCGRLGVGDPLYDRLPDRLGQDPAGCVRQLDQEQRMTAAALIQFIDPLLLNVRTQDLGSGFSVEPAELQFTPSGDW